MTVSEGRACPVKARDGPPCLGETNGGRSRLPIRPPDRWPCWTATLLAVLEVCGQHTDYL